ncbi:MAG: quinone-dependent dihydroorotate dehydrogenase, partial [Calditrichia bacterium]
MYRFLRKILFLFAPERIHDLVIGILKMPFVSKIFLLIYRYEHPALHREVIGLSFQSPVGLAAGFDKNADLLSQWSDLGFGFIEVGTVTPKSQPGNPKPRIFRLVEDEALINRMGFNNEGAEVVRDHLRKRNGKLLIAGNIGKNKITPNEKAVSDYEACFETLYDFVDFFVVNVSSPNTPNLRQLQEKEPLKKLLQRLRQLNQQKPAEKPVLLKIAPDLSDSQLDDIIEIVMELGIDGVVATNTTIRRDNLCANPQQLDSIGEGGLSGKPLNKRSTEIIRYLHQKSGGSFPIIGVGGIHSVEDAMEKFRAGASLIELYT